MRIRLVAAVIAAVFVVPVTAANAASGAAPRPQHTCPTSNDLISHHCGK